jgi:hypothetical protein
MYRRLRIRITVAAVCVVACFTVAPVLAASSSDQGLVRSYGTNANVQLGMLVELDAKDPNKVAPLTTADVNNMFGVAISPSDAPLTVSGNTGTQVYVATSGQYDVLVSNQNGIIKAGDYISASALDGIGMKADDGEPTVLGRAAADLTSNNILESNVKVRTDSGDQTVAIGIVPVTIAIATNPSAGHGTGNLPGFLQVASSNIASKPVPAPRVYAGLAILLLRTFISGVILYSGVRGSLLSIGRNPLARHSILGGLSETVLAGVAIFILGLFAVYLLLKI